MTKTLELAVAFDSTAPIYRQLEDQILFAISTGQISPGDSLPSIRNLEAELGVNRNTIRQAYLSLRDKGAIEYRRGKAARVSEKSGNRNRSEARLLSTANVLATELLRRAEAAGIDAVEMATLLSREASRHDLRYPKCAFLECNSRMAESISKTISDALGRYVLPVVIPTGEEACQLPGSIRFLFAPSWHLADAEELTGGQSICLKSVGVCLSSATITKLRTLSKKEILLLVRDAESAPGYRKQVRKLTGAKSVHAIVTTEQSQIEPKMDFDAIVYTPPSRPEALRLARARRVDSLELAFEPDPDELTGLRQLVFTAVSQSHHAA